MLIWATRVRNLGWKSPKNNHSHEISNPSCFWQNLKFRGNGSCRKTSVWCWPAPGRTAAQERKTKPMWLHVFTPLKRFGFGSNQKRVLGVFILCQLFQIPFTWLMELWTSGGNKGGNKFWIFLMFKHTLNEIPCWEREHDTAGARYTHMPLAGSQRGNVMCLSSIQYVLLQVIPRCTRKKFFPLDSSHSLVRGIKFSCSFQNSVGILESMCVNACVSVPFRITWPFH